MVERWVASAWLLKEKYFGKIDGHRDLWALATILGRQAVVQPNVGKASVKYWLLLPAFSYGWDTLDGRAIHISAGKATQL